MQKGISLGALSRTSATNCIFRCW